VIVNYARANNAELLASYRALGSSVMVLDTEGGVLSESGADAPQHWARGFRDAGYQRLVNGYFFWGPRLLAAFAAESGLPRSALVLTGCPRYDFCAEPWRAALPPSGVAAGFILVNTNFPLPNPRFAKSARQERRTLELVWGDPDYVAAVDRDAGAAFRGMLQAIAALAARFRDCPVIVRPHPFESVAPYEKLEDAGNVQVRQEGTSLQWIRDAALLVHQNCSTALEAVMLEREPVSLEWLSTEALRLAGPSAVSRQPGSQQELERGVAGILAGEHPPVPAALAAARRQIIEEFFFANDGRSCERVADVIERCLDQPVPQRAPVRRAARSVLVDLAREAAGYAPMQGLRRVAGGRLEAARRSAKAFDAAAVQALLDRLAALAGASARAAAFPPDLVARPRRYSGKSLQVVSAA
jgi:surface carbohydrate biosynthesis protein